jgi:hypothetical protein
MSNFFMEDPGESQGFSSSDSEDTSALRELPKLDEVCTACRQNFHDECDTFWISLSELGFGFTWNLCCCGGSFDAYKALRAESQAADFGGGVGYVSEDTADGKIETYFDGFDGTKDPSQYADPMSSGRKKAARVAPIKPGMICEWAWLAKAGGGVVPIIGCPGRPASDRHHGPDKNTLHNNVGVNLHRICDWCHNQWHAKNDPFYGERPRNPDGSIDATKPFIPEGTEVLAHDPETRATDEEVYQEDGLRREEARKHGAKI